MLTSADVYVIKTVGYGILSNITRIVPGFFLYGAFVVLFSATITTMIKRGLKSLPSIIIFSVTCTNFIFVSTSWACKVAAFVQSVRYTLMDQTATTFNSKTIADFNQVNWHYAIAQIALQQLMLTLSDSIVIWRAWVIIPRTRMIVFPILFVVGSAACGFAQLVIISSNFRWYIAYNNLKLSLVNVLLDASIALSFLANTFATLLIVHTLWLHLKSRKAVGLHKKPSRVLKVLVIIIDTGVAFLLLQGLNILLDFLPFEHYSAFDFFQTAISSTYDTLTGMYPTIVIYFVNQQRSLVEVFVISDPSSNSTPGAPLDRTITIGPLAFARPGTTADVTSLTNVSDMGFTDAEQGSALSPVDSLAREKAHDMV